MTSRRLLLLRAVDLARLKRTDGRFAEAWVKCHVFAVYFRHSAGWAVRNGELMRAVLRRVAGT